MLPVVLSVLFLELSACYGTPFLKDRGVITDPDDNLILIFTC